MGPVKASYSQHELDELLASAATFDEILAWNVDERGFVTNEHRHLAIGQAPG